MDPCRETRLVQRTVVGEGGEDFYIARSGKHADLTCVIGGRRGGISPAQGSLNLGRREGSVGLSSGIQGLRFFPNLGVLFLPIESSEARLYLLALRVFFPNGPQKTWRLYCALPQSSCIP